MNKTLIALRHEDAEVYEARYQSAKAAALHYLYNYKENNFANKYDSNQISVHSVVWMILGGVVQGNLAWDILQSAMNDSESLKPVTPYMNHYLVEAITKLGRGKFIRKMLDGDMAFWC